MIKYYRDAEGNYLGSWERGQPPEAIEVPNPPQYANQKWGVDDWLPPTLTPEQEDMEEIKRDPEIQTLLSKRPSEIDDHYGQMVNVPALAEQVALLTKQIKLLSK